MKYPSVVQTNSDPAGFLALTFSMDGLIDSLSSSIEQATEYAAGDLIGRPITHLLADRSAFDVPHMIESARQTGSWHGEIVLRCRSGKCLTTLATLTQIAGKEEALRCYLLVSLPDIAAAQGGDAVLIRDVAVSLRKISHELNNPLAVMMGFAQLILLNTRCEGQIRTDMEKLYSELKRVIQVVDDLHSYAVALQDEHTAGRPSFAKHA
ncbi:MAG TPA: histidine kinase dimerization/phospho-acceptor domain-containing protein [Acidobacteriota bacterium]|nr:histidine kinase dimerization/phospho-acceptor domain-containing protein [Acidobacteriota bacterium]